MPPIIRSRPWFSLVVALAFCLATWTSFAGPKESDQVWVATWGASPVAPLPANTANPGFTNQTVRLVVHTSLGGNEVRVRLSNAFGTESLVIGAAHLALRSMNAGTVSGTDRALTFAGSGSVTIPPGALV
ncbi:MAG: SGNH/GDSL hydrolase family protein, partial [Acidobacteria bacterium]